jgi:hypothetical protein
MHPFTQESKKNRKLILSFFLSLTLVCSGFHGAVSAKKVPKTKVVFSTADVKNSKKTLLNNIPNKNETEKVAFGFVIIGGAKLAEVAVILASLYLVLCKNDLNVVNCVSTYVDNFNNLHKITGKYALELKKKVQEIVQQLVKNQRKKGALTPEEEAKQIFNTLKKNDTGSSPK